MEPGRSDPAAPAGRSRDWAARLPFEVALGPHHLSVEWRERAHRIDPRRPASLNLEAGRIELQLDLDRAALAAAFFGCLVELTHSRRGSRLQCTDGECAHSLATGLVEFALRNPRAWLWLNLLLCARAPAGWHFDRAARGALATAPPPPRRIVLAGRPIGLRCTQGQAGADAFGAYDAQRHEVRWSAGLAGTDLAVVALQEITQAMHDRFGLGAHDSCRTCSRVQQRAWLELVHESPHAWQWLAWTMSAPLRTQRARS